MDRDERHRTTYSAYGGVALISLLFAIWLYSGRDFLAVHVAIWLLGFVGLPCIGLALGWYYSRRQPDAKSVNPPAENPDARSDSN